MCTGEVALADLTEAARKVLSAAVRTGERFGAHHLVDILTGNPTDKVLERGHDSLPTYGIGRDQNREWWLDLVRDLDAAGCIRRGEGRTAGYSLSSKGRLILQGKETFLGTRSAEVTQKPLELEVARLDGPALDGLFQSLRQLRKRIADARGLPGYIVFSDKTLRAMAEPGPRTPRASCVARAWVKQSWLRTELSSSRRYGSSERRTYDRRLGEGPAGPP